MSLSDRIIRSLKEMDKPSDFQMYRNILRTRSKLPQGDWSSLCKLVKSSKLYGILRMDLSKKEAEVLGNALKKASLSHVDDIIEIIVKKGDKNGPILLKHILEKKKKIETSIIQKYLHNELSSKVNLSHLQLLSVVHKNYPSCVDSTIIEFCHSNAHPICKEVLGLEMDVIGQ